MNTTNFWIKNSRIRLRVFALFFFLCFSLSYTMIDSSGIRRVQVVGESMEPTLHTGDIMVVDQKLEPQVGDIVVCKLGDCGYLIVKRITAGPGDIVEFEGREMVLGVDEFFVMGDNRQASTDSRDFGPIHRDNIWGVTLD